MEYQALYRKYRSQTFDEIAGQQHIVKTFAFNNVCFKKVVNDVIIFWGE